MDDLRLAIALRGALRPEDRRVYEQELQEWELAPGFCSALLRLYASPPAQFGVPERLLAVLCLKNAVQRRWHARRPAEEPIPEQEKAAVRQGLLGTLDCCSCWHRWRAWMAWPRGQSSCHRYCMQRRARHHATRRAVPSRCSAW